MDFKKLSPYAVALSIFLVALNTRLIYWQYVGSQSGSDTPRYADAAQAILESSGNPAALITIGQPLYFWFYPLIIALVGSNIALVIVVQIVLQSFAAVLVYKTGTLLFNRTAGVLAAVVYALFWEAIQWDVYLLTDSVFLFLVTALLYVYSLIITGGDRKYWWWMGGLLVAALLQRPHGLVVDFIFGVGLLLQLPRRTRLIVIALGSLLIVSYLIILSANSVNQNIDVYYRIVSNFYADGVVVDGRTAYNLAPGNSLVSIIWIILNRIWAFWFIYPAEFSLAHKLLNTVFLVPLYFFGIYGAFDLWTRSAKNRHAIRFMIAFVVAYTVAVSVTNVDYDWRLRLPVWPFVMVVFGYGFSLFLERLRHVKAAKSVPA